MSRDEKKTTSAESPLASNHALKDSNDAEMNHHHEMEKRSRAIKKIAGFFKKITEFSKDKNLRKAGRIGRIMGIMHSIKVDTESDCHKGVPENEAFLTAVFTNILECRLPFSTATFETAGTAFILTQLNSIQDTLCNTESPHTERITKVAGRFFAKATIHLLTSPLPSEDALSLETSLFLDFLEVNIQDLKKQHKTKPIEILLADHVALLKDEYQWSPEVENCYGFLFSCHVAPHLVYDEEGIHFDTTPSETNIAHPISALSQEQKNEMSDIIQHVYDETMDRVTTYASGIYLAEQLETDSARQIVMQQAELTEAVLGQHLKIISDKMASTVPAMNHEPQNNTTAFFNPGGLKSNLNEIVSLSNDGAMLASILDEPRLSQHLSMVSSSIERTITGFQKLEQGVSLISNLAGAVSLFTGVIGIATGICGLCAGFAQEKRVEQLEKQMDHLSEQMVNLGKQTEHLGKQLDCVLRNQLAMTDLLLYASQSIQHVGNQLTRLAHITLHNFEFLKTKDLIEAVSNVRRYIKNESAVPLTLEDLRLALITHQSWLVDPEHLCSMHMNGGLYADKPLPSKEAVEILSSFDDRSSIHMVGFILKLIQKKGIVIPEPFFNLPSLELYTNTVESFYLGMGELKPTGGDGCRAISKHLQNTYALFSEFIHFLSNNDDMWRRLLSLYLNYLSKAYHQIYQHYGFSSSISTVSAHLSEQSDNDANKITLLNAVNNFEEIRLLLHFLNKWTNRFPFFVTQLPSRNDFLKLKMKEVSEFSTRGFYSYLQDTKEMSGVYIAQKALDAILYTKNLVAPPLANTSGSLRHFFFKKKLMEKAGVYIAEKTLNDILYTNNLVEPPLANLSDSLMEFFFNKKLYELLILHFASGSGSSYVCPLPARKFTLFPSACNIKMMSAAKAERQVQYKNGADATDFMVIVSLFVGDKLKALRNAYQYYAARFNNDQSEAAQLRASVNPSILLWLVAILGRYDIFQSLPIPDTFNYDVVAGTQTVGSYTPKYIDLDEYYYTTTLNKCGNTQRLVCQKSYTPPIIPLMIAAKFNHVEVIQGLLNVYCIHQKDIGLQMKNSAGQTAAEIAFNYGHRKVAKLLDDYSHTLPEEVKKQLALESNNDGSTRKNIVDILKYGTSLAQHLETTHRGPTAPHLFSSPPPAPAHVESTSNRVFV